MNIVNQLTLRYLKQNKKRTLVTIIGVIISVAMITAVTTLGVSFMDLLQRQTIANEGKWHVLYKDVNRNQLAAIQDDETTKTLILTKDRGYAYLEGSNNKNKPYLFVKEYSAAGFEQFPIVLSSGRLPQNENEVVISEEIAKNAKVQYRIGEQITLDVGHRSMSDNETNAIELNQHTSLRTQDGKPIEALINQETVTFTVVGTIERPIWEPTWAPGYTVIGFIDESMLSTRDSIDVAVVANLTKSLEISQDGVNFDIRVGISRDAETNKGVIESLTSRNEVTAYTVMREVTANTWLKEELAAIQLREQLKTDPSVLKDGKYPYYLNIYALDAEALKAYAQTAGADYDQLVNSEKLTGVVIDTTPYRDTATRKYVETKSSEAKIGQSIDVFYKLPGETGEVEYINKIEIAALTDEVTMGVFPAGLGGLSIIVSEETLDRLSPDKAIYDLQTSLFLKSSDPMATQYAIEDMQESDFFVYNVYQARQREEQTILIMSVFTYGFIVLITAICIANIFNTISTSIALRKREFAMLKSIGMTPNGFNKMINYESIFYGLKSLFYGLPLSIIVMVLIYRSLMNTFSYGFALPWTSILFAVAAVFIIVTSAMLYAGVKVKNENIIDALKQENI